MSNRLWSERLSVHLERAEPVNLVNSVSDRQSVRFGSKRSYWVTIIDPWHQSPRMRSGEGFNRKEYYELENGFFIEAPQVWRCETLLEAQQHAWKVRRDVVLVHQYGDVPVHPATWRETNAQEWVSEHGTGSWAVWKWERGIKIPFWMWAIDYRGRIGTPAFAADGFEGLQCISCQQLMPRLDDHPCQPTGTILIPY